jgi:hypothetical protein
MNKIEELQKRFQEEMEKLIENDPELQKIIRDEEERIHKEDSKRTIMNILKELRESDETIRKIFLNGSCYKLCKILKVIYPTSSALYSIQEGHWITRIGNEYYDINGRLKKEYVMEKSYEEHPEYEVSADIPTHTNNIGTSYNKYAEI